MARQIRQIVIQELLNEVERRKRSRDINRFLRDENDPFLQRDNLFRKIYRLSREAARDLFLEIQEYFIAGERRSRVPPVTRFFAALHFFAHGSYQKVVGADQHCGLSQAAVSNALHEVVEILVAHLSPIYIKFPRTQNEIMSVKQDFFEKFHFPGILGCIDGTFIAIVPPPANHPTFPGHVFINRKNYHALNVLIVCDANLKILSLNARFPGSVHDSAVYMMSAIKRTLQARYENGERLSWLLGDSGYPLEPYLLTPVIGALPGTPEERYNIAQRRARNSIERCIGTLKAYFRCLRKDRVLHYTPPFAANITSACAILHNILRQRNIIDDELEIEYDEENADENIEHNNLLHQGQQIRQNVILRHFY